MHIYIYILHGLAEADLCFHFGTVQLHHMLKLRFPLGPFNLIISCWNCASILGLFNLILSCCDSILGPFNLIISFMVKLRFQPFTPVPCQPPSPRCPIGLASTLCCAVPRDSWRPSQSNARAGAQWTVGLPTGHPVRPLDMRNTNQSYHLTKWRVGFLVKTCLYFIVSWNCTDANLYLSRHQVSSIFIIYIYIGMLISNHAHANTNLKGSELNHILKSK